METVHKNDEVRLAQITFRIENDASQFHMPVLVNKDEFDEADLTKVARSVLHHMLAELSQVTEVWKLSEQELEQLSSWKFYQGA